MIFSTRKSASFRVLPGNAQKHEKARTDSADDLAADADAALSDSLDDARIMFPYNKNQEQPQAPDGCRLKSCVRRGRGALFSKQVGKRIVEGRRYIFFLSGALLRLRF